MTIIRAIDGHASIRDKLGLQLNNVRRDLRHALDEGIEAPAVSLCVAVSYESLTDARLALRTLNTALAEAMDMLSAHHLELIDLDEWKCAPISQRQGDLPVAAIFYRIKLCPAEAYSQCVGPSSYIGDAIDQNLHSTEHARQQMLSQPAGFTA